MPAAILAVLSGLGGDHAAMKTAIAAARRLGGHITCLHARADAVETAAAMEMLFPQFELQTAMRQVERQETARSQHAWNVFDTACRAHKLVLREEADTTGDVTASWKEVTLRFDETVDEARHHDLVVMARDPGQASPGIEAVLMHAGRPLLLAAPSPGETVGRHVALAWKNGPEAARAVTAAAGLLQRAEQVSILVACENEPADDPGGLSARRLADALRWQGVKARPVVQRVSSGTETALLQAMAYEEEVDAIVMGAYGHSRLREFVLGGVTAGMLSDCALPVFMFR
jgi:nucleotide-binding universal stress UspA family protein